MSTSPPKYIPLDEIMSAPRIRILRALRHFDWVRSDDLFDALDVPDHNGDETTRDTYTAAIGSNFRMGLAERRRAHGARGVVNEYRITDKGRAALAQIAADYEARLQGAIP